MRMLNPPEEYKHLCLDLPDTGMYTCSLPLGHNGQHEAYLGHETRHRNDPMRVWKNDNHTIAGI